ncbi:kinase-like domain-containing protein, partial [Rhizophagus diaphanus]
GDFIIILECAEGGNFNGYLYKNHEVFDWLNKLQILIDIIRGLGEIHQNHMVHRDFHIGNILFKYIKYNNTCISDMGLCKVGNSDETKIYGVMPYVAPEVLRGGHYTQTADIYSFGMIMYFVVTGKQPFSDRAHDKLLALDICNEIRPEINEPKAPKCYIDLMKKCWNSNPNNRQNAFKIEKIIWFLRPTTNKQSHWFNTDQPKKPKNANDQK